MTMQKLFLAVGLLAAVCTAVTAAGCRRPVRSALANGLLGAAALGAAELAAAQTGMALSLSWGTALFSVALGLPGVICLLFLRFLAMV